MIEEYASSVAIHGGKAGGAYLWLSRLAHCATQYEGMQTRQSKILTLTDIDNEFVTNNN